MSIHIDSIKAYLEDLEESGVDGFPLSSYKAEAKKEIQIETKKEITSLNSLNKEISSCTICEHSKVKLLGEGDISSKIIFITEPPSLEETIEQKFFVGAVGKMFERIITAMGLKRDLIYITSIAKCKNGENCLDFLKNELTLLSPKVVVLMGDVSVKSILNADVKSKRATVMDYDGLKVIATYHPKTLVENQADKKLFWDVWEDMLLALKTAEMPIPEKKK